MEQAGKDRWNGYQVIGPKLPLKRKEIWHVRIRLQMASRIRDLALFDVGLDSKLRGCDLVKLRISDVTVGRSVRSRCMVVQQKTGRPVQFEITDACKESLIAWLELRGLRDDDWIFPSRNNRGGHLTTRQYCRLVDEWVTMIGLDPASYCLAIANWKAQCATSASILRMRSACRNISRFESQRVAA
jgi:integrase